MHPEATTPIPIPIDAIAQRARLERSRHISEMGARARQGLRRWRDRRVRNVGAGRAAITA